MDTGCTTGGILQLRELIEEHPAELAYDFRHRFGLTYEAIGVSLSWLEAILLVSILLRDTSSWLHAAKASWDYPVTREWIVSAHTYDLLAAVNSKKPPKPYPAPWPDKNSKKIGSKTAMTADAVKSRLEMMNPKESDG